MSPVVWGKSSADDAIFGALMEGASGATVDNRANVFSSIVLFPIHVPIALPFDWDTLRPGRIIGEAMTVMDSWLPFVADYRRNTATLGDQNVRMVRIRGTCEWQIVRNHQQHNIFPMPLRGLCKLLNGERIGTAMILRCWSCDWD